MVNIVGTSRIDVLQNSEAVVNTQMTRCGNSN